MIYLTCDSSRWRPPALPPRSLCVYHREYSAPSFDGETVEWSLFKQDPRPWLAGCGCLVVIGLNKIMTPSNRTDQVFEVLFNLTRDIPKISVDTTLFVSEPWRAWFHFGLTGAPYREYTYSYLAESQWRSYEDGARAEDPFSLSEITRWGTGVIQSDYRRYFDLDVETIPVSPEIHEEYAREKERAFEEEHTAPAIVRRLAAIAQKALPARSIPSRLFNRRRHTIVRTDLKVDEWLLSRLTALADLSNQILETFSCPSSIKKTMSSPRPGSESQPFLIASTA